MLRSRLRKRDAGCCQRTAQVQHHVRNDLGGDGESEDGQKDSDWKNVQAIAHQPATKRARYEGISLKNMRTSLHKKVIIWVSW